MAAAPSGSLTLPGTSRPGPGRGTRVCRRNARSAGEHPSVCILRCETGKMGKQETVSLRKHLDSLLRMKGPPLSFEAAVADFPATLRGAKPAGVPHSAWELLEHMRIAQEDILDFSRNPNYREKKFPRSEEHTSELQ